MAHDLSQGREAGYGDVAHRRMVTPETLEIKAAKKLNGKRHASPMDHVLPGNCVRS